MKLLQINAVFGNGSTGTIMRELHEIALQNGIDSYVAFPEGHGKADQRSILIGNYYDHKLHAIFSRISGKQAYFSRLATNRFLNEIDRLQPDIIHLHNLHSNYINLNMLLKYLAKENISTVITMHDCWYFTGGCFHFHSVRCDKWMKSCGNCPKRYLDTPAYLYDSSQSILKDRERYLNSIPDLTLVGCSEWIANECRKSKLGTNNIISISNGFDIDIFKPSSSNLRSELQLEDKVVLLAPAQKWGQDVNKPTLEYFIENMDDNMVLLFFGGNLSSDIESDKIRNLGFISAPKRMAEIYSMSDIMINCSREDTLSSINIEAQACGTPVVTYADTGNSETVNGKSSYAVPNNNPKLLLQQAKLILSKDKQTVEEDCVEFVRTNYEKNKNFNRYINLYNDLMKNRI